LYLSDRTHLRSLRRLLPIPQDGGYANESIDLDVQQGQDSSTWHDLRSATLRDRLGTEGMKVCYT
jgi:hypothetical protein